MDILQIQDVSKAFENYLAVNGVSFNLPAGSIFGLLGPNGAGKTTLIRMINHITNPDSGQILFQGEPLTRAHIDHIGYMPEERGLYKKMKVGEHLLYLAQLKGLSKAEAKSRLEDWSRRLEIESWWTKKIEELSKGMQQKIQFIATVIHNPQLLILDEPFSGLDPINTNLIKDEISRLNREGTTVIFSTHRMEQVEEICERIVLINKGKKILEGKVQEIRQHYKKHRYLIEYTGEIPENTLNHYTLVSQTDHQLQVQLLPDQDSNTLLNILIQSGVHITTFKELLPSVNEIFITQVEENN